MKTAKDKIILKWEDVAKRHGSQSGVQLESGRVVSVLCGGLDHPGHVSESNIRYSVPLRPFYTKCILALRTCATNGNDFTVFYKLRPNVWHDLGRFTVSEIEIRKNDVLFSFIHLIS